MMLEVYKDFDGRWHVEEYDEIYDSRNFESRGENLVLDGAVKVYFASVKVSFSPSVKYDYGEPPIGLPTYKKKHVEEDDDAPF